MGSAGFEYTNLADRHEIRILRVDSIDTETGRLSCTLLHTSTEDSNRIIPWISLSYRWGDSRDTVPFRVRLANSTEDSDGSTGSSLEYKTATAPRTALHVLTELYESQRIADKWVWIDAISINQADLDEKSIQVRLMNNVYHKAEAAIVYVGSAINSTTLAMEFWSRLEEYFAGLKADDGDGPLKLISFETLFEKTATSWESAEWTALREHLTRDWFGRTWTIQEAVLPSDVEFVWGDESLSWERLSKLRDWDHRCNISMLIRGGVAGRAWSSISVLHKIGWLRDNRKGAQEGKGWTCDLSYALYQCDATEATDPRDRIYGLLGLLYGRQPPLEIVPDYGPGNTASQVFTDATAKWTAQNDSFDLLYAAGIGHERSLEDLPSWAPDYTKTMAQYPGGHLRAGKGNIAGYLQPLTFIAGDMHVQLFKIDTIEAVLDLAIKPTGNEGRGNVEKDPLVKWYIRESINLVKTIHPGLWSDRTFDTFWRTLSRNSVVNAATDGGVEAPRDYGATCESLDVVLESGVRMPLGRKAVSALQRQRFLSTVAGYMVGQKTCTTRREMFGLSPLLCQAGDTVVVFPGARVPFVVRGVDKIQEGKPVFRLVGQCYFHHLNEGVHMASALGELQEVVLR